MSSDGNWIVVPTYWTHSSLADGTQGEETVVFDHPTPLNEKGTLLRTLECFGRLRGDFNVLVVAACAHPSLGEAVSRHVRDLIAPLAGAYPLFLVSPPDVSRLNALLGEPLLALDSYGSIRNVQLFVPHLLGARVTIGIDDDEVIADRDFVAKAVEHPGRTCQGERVGGVAGPYFDAHGEYRIADAEALAGHGNVFVMKNYFMNEGLKKVMQAPCPDGIVKSNMAFGGNMCMARATVAAVCHDPYIPRGEDYDYVINAAMEGISFFFRPDMGITHLPPDSTGSQAADKLSKLLADIRRFVYMREKCELHAARWPERRVPLDYLLPYPGVYLDRKLDLRQQGIAALDELYPEFRGRTSPEAFVDAAFRTARIKAEEYFAYRSRWADALARAGRVAGLREAAVDLCL